MLECVSKRSLGVNGGRAHEEIARIEADTLGLMCPEPLPQEEFDEGQAGGSER